MPTTPPVRSSTTAATRPVRLNVEHVPGAPSLIGDPVRGGFAWAGRFPSRAAAVMTLLRRALAICEDDDADR